MSTDTPRQVDLFCRRREPLGLVERDLVERALELSNELVLHQPFEVILAKAKRQNTITDTVLAEEVNFQRSLDHDAAVLLRELVRELIAARSALSTEPADTV